MIYCNGEFIEDSTPCISVQDRGFLYGDGLFETMRILNGSPVFWKNHFSRFSKGAEALSISLPHSEISLHSLSKTLIEMNSLKQGLLRIQLSRGSGKRGYSTANVKSATLLISTHSLPGTIGIPNKGWALKTSSYRIDETDPLNQVKTCSKLKTIMAMAEAEQGGFDDALMINTKGEVVESTRANLFWMLDGAIHTAPINSGALPGITRSKVIDLCNKEGSSVVETRIQPDDLLKAEGVFATVSTYGLVDIIGLDGQEIPKSPTTTRLSKLYQILLHSTGSL